MWNVGREVYIVFLIDATNLYLGYAYLLMKISFKI